MKITFTRKVVAFAFYGPMALIETILKSLFTILFRTTRDEGFLHAGIVLTCAFNLAVLNSWINRIVSNKLDIQEFIDNEIAWTEKALEEHRAWFR